MQEEILEKHERVNFWGTTDIIFRSTNMHLVKEFSKLMQGEFEMILIGELNYFLRLQIKQLDEGTFVC